MKRIIDKEQLIGKTISRTAYTENKFFLFFNDDSYCIFSGCGYGDWDVELSTESFNTVPNDFNLNELREIGLISEEQYLILMEERKRKDLEQKRASDLEKLAALRKQYPDA